MNRVDVLGGLSNSDDISSTRYGGGMVVNNNIGGGEEPFSNKNVFSYQQNLVSGNRANVDQMSHSFNYSEYS